MARPQFARSLDILETQLLAPTPTSVDPRVLVGIAALLIAALLLLLYFYRRRSYILGWVAGWVFNAASLFVAAQQFTADTSRYAAYGLSQFLAIAGSILFLLSVYAFRSRLRLRRAHGLAVLPVVLWFLLAPIALGPAAVFGPGHLLTAAGLMAAGAAHLLLLRNTRLLGAAVVGTILVIVAASNVWLVIEVQSSGNDAVSRTLFLHLGLYLVAALGMQLMVFEDMTYELRASNSRLEAAQSDLRQLVTTDPLTGCRNRRYFEQVIGKELVRHRRYHVPLSLLFVDIDRFKAINDALGHETGDRVLQKVAGFLVSHLREADYVFRWGGDEFLILISCEEEEAARKGRELQQAFASSADAASLPRGVGLSIGCAQVPPDADDIMALVRVADERMYLDKKR